MLGASTSFFSENHRAYNIVKNGFQVVIGSGEKIQFWQEVSWDSVPLMNAFPRIFALATNKNGVVFEFGSWVDSRWVWDVNLRRAVFDWELDQWNCFKLCLENIKLRVDISDALAWSYVSNGIFSVSSFRRIWRKIIIGLFRFVIFCGKGFVLQRWRFLLGNC